MYEEYKSVKWRKKDVELVQKIALRKKFEAEAALFAGGRIEQEYWKQFLARKFPQLINFKCPYEIYLVDKFIGVIEYQDNKTEKCIISDPTVAYSGSAYGHNAIVNVWYPKANGKGFLKDAAATRCAEILPFISSVALIENKNDKERPLVRG